VGTETDGSIVCPAHANGIVGVKPTLGLVSRSGVIPISHSQDTAGPLARSVEDAAILLSCLAGYDPLDSATNPLQNKPIPVYRDSLKMKGLHSARIGIARIFFGFDSRVDRIIENSIKIMRDLGADVVDPVDLINPAKYGRSEIEVLLYDFKSDLDQYLASLAPGTRVKNLDDVIKFNKKNKDRVMPFFGQERMLAAKAKGPLTSKQYLRSLERARRMAGAQGIDATLQKHNLDAIVAPSGNPAWLIDLVNGDQAGGPDTSSPPAVAGYPHITVPAGYVFGLPVGISFIGSAWSEQKLLCLAYAFEQASNARQPPQFLPTVDFSRE